MAPNGGQAAGRTRRSTAPAVLAPGASGGRPRRRKTAWAPTTARISAGLLTLPDIRRLASPTSGAGFGFDPVGPISDAGFDPRLALAALGRWFRIPVLTRLRLPAWPGAGVQWLLRSLRGSKAAKPGRVGRLQKLARTLPRPPEAPPSAGLALAFEQLCRTLGRPFSAAEIRAAAPPIDQGMTLGNLLLRPSGWASRRPRSSLMPWPWPRCRRLS